MKLIQTASRLIKETTVELKDENKKTWFMFVTHVSNEKIKVTPSSFCKEDYDGLSPIQKNIICSTAIKFANQ